MLPRLRLGEIMVREGLLSSQALEEALDRQRLLGGLLGTNLLDLEAVPEEVLLRALGQHTSAPVVRGDELTRVPKRVLAHMPAEIAERYRVVPFRVDGNTLLVASMKPGDIPLEDLLGEATELMIRTHVTLELRLWEALHKYYKIPTPYRVTQVLHRMNDSSTTTGDGLVLPKDLTRETQPLTTLVVPEPSPFDLLTVEPPSDESLWGGLHMDEIEAKLRGHKANDELEEAIRLSDSIKVQHPPQSDDTQPASTVHVSATRMDRHGVDRLGAPPPEPPRLVPAGLGTTSTSPALEELRGTERRDRVAELVLELTSQYFRRRLLLASRQNRIIGWRGTGTGIVPLRIHTLNFEPSDSPIFLALEKGSPFWLGSLVDNEVHHRITEIFGGRKPGDCVLLPIRVRDRAVGYFYGDNLDGSVVGTPISELQPVMEAAASGLLSFIRAKRREQATMLPK